MLINKPITNPLAVGVEFRLLLNNTIRDLSVAYLAISDCHDRETCVQTLRAVQVKLIEAHGKPIVLQRKPTGISNDSLRTTLGSIVSVAQAFAAEYDVLIEDETMTPDDLSRWLTSRGETVLRGLPFLIADLLTEKNLDMIQARSHTTFD